jgi:hypothetical protein
MNALIKQIESVTRGKFVWIPIQKINDIDVSVTAYNYEIMQQKHYAIKVESDQCVWGDENQYNNHFTLYSLHDTDLKKLIEDFIKVLPDLKFNKFRGEFYIGEVNNDDLEIAELFECMNVTVYHDKCACCFDKTKTKTKCKHTVCLQCWDKIKTNVCPICRCDMTNGQEDGSY